MPPTRTRAQRPQTPRSAEVAPVQKEPAPDASPEATLLALQAKAGNRAVQRLVTAVQRAGTLDAKDEATLEAALEANGADVPEDMNKKTDASDNDNDPTTEEPANAPDEEGPENEEEEPGAN